MESSVQILWRFLLLLVLGLLSLSNSVLAVPENSSLAIGIGPPEIDDFYKPPSGFESTALGSILRHRPVPRPISLDNKTPVKVEAAWQLLYRTQNAVGDPEATVVTVLVPHNAKKNNLFVYSYFSHASYNGCNPSVTVQLGSRPDSSVAKLQNMVLVTALFHGWYVSIADDTGTQASYSNGLHSAYASLDSIRAIKQSGNITGISADPIVTINGYSSGAITVGWTTELQPSYAPDVNIAGAALGGIIPNLTHQIEIHRNDTWTPFEPPSILGLAHDYANLSTWLDENLVPETAAEFRKSDKQCYVSNIQTFRYMDLGKYLKRGFSSIFDPIPLSVLTNAGLMGQRGTPKIPWYLFGSIGDDASPVQFADRLVEKFCSKGANILYERNPMNLTHRNGAIAGWPGSMKWMEERHIGNPIEPGCNTVILTKYSVQAFMGAGLLEVMISNLFALLGVPVGSSEPT